MEQRIQKFTAWLQEEEIDFAFISSTANLFYLTRFYCDPHERLLGLFLFPEEEPFLVCPKMEESRAKQAGWQGAVLSYDDVENPWERIKQELQKRAVPSHPKVAIEKQHLSFDRAEQLLSLYPKARFQGAEKKLHHLRLIKEEEEIKILSQAAEVADMAVSIGVNALQKGRTEQEVVAEIEYELKKKGIEGMSFPTTVLFGEKTALPHGVPGDRTLAAGDFVLFDLGVVIDGYCSDITRTFVFQEVSDKQREIYKTVLHAQETALSLCRPGVRIGELDQRARSIIREAGYGEYFPHRLGHGLGIEVHEYPSIHERVEEPLQEGMVFTVEPGIYIPELGGVRIEDDVLITNNGATILTQFPKELQVVGN